MADTYKPIAANVVKELAEWRVWGGGKSSKQQLKTQGKAHAAVLKKDIGVVGSIMFFRRSADQGASFTT
jgi:hypothetical protein